MIGVLSGASALVRGRSVPLYMMHGALNGTIISGMFLGTRRAVLKLGSPREPTGVATENNSSPGLGQSGNDSHRIASSGQTVTSAPTASDGVGKDANLGGVLAGKDTKLGAVTAGKEEKLGEAVQVLERASRGRISASDASMLAAGITAAIAAAIQSMGLCMHVYDFCHLVLWGRNFLGECWP